MTTTQVPDTMTRQAVVAEASQVEGRNGATQWALRLEIKDISQFPIPCFMPLERAAQVLKGSTHLVTMRRSKTKQGKEGKYPSEYFWDLTHWDVQAPVAQAPAAQPPRATEKPQAATSPASVPWDAADTQSRISWAQAVNLGVAVLGRFHDDYLAEVTHVEQSYYPMYVRSVEAWANRFYPLIRKGPTLPDPANPTEDDLGYGGTGGIVEPPDSPFPDAPKPHQEAPSVASAPRKPFPVQGEKETAFNYMERVAQEVYGKSRDQMLKAIGSNWPAWEMKHKTPQAAVQAAILRLAEE